jgi:hypothetical protein
MNTKVPLPARRLERAHDPRAEPDWRLRRLRSVVRLLDTVFEIPGTGWRIGLDAIVGLIPGIGDLVTTGLAAWIITEARHMGVSRTTLVRMAWNVGIDFLVGAVPVAGDVFDAAWKANVKNLQLVERDLARRGRIVPDDPRPAAGVPQELQEDFSGPERGENDHMEPRITTAAVVAIVSAIASFMTGAFWGLILAIVAVLAGVLGLLLAVSRSRRGAILSIAAIVIGAIALVRALLVAVF